MMKLFYSYNSPYARKVRVCALEKGVMDRITQILSPPSENSPDLLAANPLGRIPVLVLEDGQTVFDSPVICEYLDSLSAQPSLIPASGQERLYVRKMEALADGMMDGAVSRYQELMRPELERSLHWIKRWEDGIKRALDVLEDGGEKLPEDLNLGSIALAVALAYVTLRTDLNWQETHLKTAAWLREFEKRDSMQKTKPVV